jgi:hypothetical protein
MNFDDVALLSSFVPNPGMETTGCGALPCDWSGSPGSATDTTIRHTGTASLSVSVPDSTMSNVASACADGAGAGSYDASTWYRTATPGSAGITLFYWDAASCAGNFLGQFAGATAASGDSVWHYLSEAAVAPTGTRSIQIQLSYNCTSCAAPSTMNFDDVALEGGFADTTAVALSAFHAVNASTGVRVVWRTGSEAGLLGFEVWRGSRKLTGALIAARGGPRGASYSFLDGAASASRRTVYRLVAVNLAGARRVLGVVHVEGR